MAGQIVVREMEIKAGNNQTYELLAGDNFIVIGISYDTTSNQHLTAVLVDSVQNATVVQQTSFVNGEGAELWYLHSPNLGAAVVIGASGPVSNLVFCVFKCNLARIANTVRDSDGATDGSNDVMNTPNIDSDGTDTAFYMGKRQSGTNAWSNIGGGSQSTEVDDSIGAWEPGGSPTVQATYGAAGAADARIVVVGASVRGPTRAGGPQGWFA